MMAQIKSDLVTHMTWRTLLLMAQADICLFFFCNNGVKFLVPRAWRNRHIMPSPMYNHKTTLAGRAMPAIDLLCLVATCRPSISYA